MATNGATAHVPPQNLEAERSVLGAMMVSASSLDPVFADVRLATDDFYRERHRVVYEAIKRLYERDEAVDALTVTEFLTQTASSRQPAAAPRSRAFPTRSRRPATPATTRRIVKQNALLRRLLAAAQQIQQLGPRRARASPSSSPSRPSASSSRRPTASRPATSAS